MIAIVRIDGTGDFPLFGGPYDFTEVEVDEVEVVPHEDLVEVFSQTRAMTIYRNGTEHFEIEIGFVIDNYETLLKLDDIRQHKAPLTVWPSFRDEPSVRYEVLWRNPNDFTQRLKRGWHRAGYTFTMRLREPLGAPCAPPEAIS